MSASHTVGREFASRPGDTKDHHKNGTNCLPAWHAMRLDWSLAVQPNCLKGRVVCGTVYGDMHLKDHLGSIIRVGCCIPVLDFYLVLHGLCCRKLKLYSGLINQSINCRYKTTVSKCFIEDLTSTQFRDSSLNTNYYDE